MIIKKIRGNKKTARGKDATAEAKQDSKASVQQWLPFKDVADGVVYRRDGGLVSVLRVRPYNFALKSKNEKKRVISAVHEAFNGQREPVQILCLGRPVDLDAYLRHLENLSRDLTGKPGRRRLLQNYLRYVSGMVAGGEALERRYYILLPHKKGSQAREEAIQRAFELKEMLEGAGLDVDVCNDQEIIDLLFCFTQPVQAAFERPPALIPHISTQVDS